MNCGRNKEPKEVQIKKKLAKVFKEFIEMKDEIIGRFVIAEQRQRLTKIGCQIREYFVCIVMCTERVHYGINVIK